MKTRFNHLYLLCHHPCYFMVKLGISSNVSTRQKRIDRSLRFGRTVRLCSIQVPLAGRWEKVMLRLFKWCRWGWLGGSGRTEWFFLFPALIVIPLMLFFRVFWWLVMASGLVFFLKMVQ